MLFFGGAFSVSELTEMSFQSVSTLRFIEAFQPLPPQKGKQTCTPRKVDMEPENDGVEDEFPFQLGEFLVPC